MGLASQIDRAHVPVSSMTMRGVFQQPVGVFIQRPVAKGPEPVREEQEGFHWDS